MNELECANRLAKLINIKTISSDFLKDEKTFVEFFNVCKEMFKELFDICEVNKFENGFYLIYKGKNHNKPILFMNHHDVVPTSDKWNTNPFDAVIKDGKIYGRGVIDTKGGLYCMLEAANNLAKEGFVPEQDIYLLSDADEEVGGKGGNYISSYFKEKGIEFDYVLDEGSLIINKPVAFSNGKFALIAVGEKAITEIRFSATSTGGHSSNPDKNSVLVRLSKFILDVEHSKKFKKKILKPTKLMLKNLATKSSGITKFVLSHPNFFYPLLKVILSKSSPVTRSMIRTTVAFTYSRCNDSYNVMPTYGEVVANIRISHNQSVDEILNILETYAKKYNLKMEIINKPFNCKLSPSDGAAIKKISEAIVKEYPDVIPSPFVASSASDARYFSRVSKQVYGIVPFLVESSQLGGIHGDNECLDIACLPKAINIYTTLMKNNN